MSRRIFALAVLFFSLSDHLLSQVRGSETLMTQIHGQVFYADGRAAGEGIQVQLLPSSGGVSQDVQTDRSGKFLFQGLAPSRYTVLAHMPGFVDASQEFDMSIAASAYATLTLRAVPGQQNTAATGLVAVLPSDMPEAARTEFSAGYSIITSGKDLGKAIPHFKKVTESYPGYAPAYLLLGTAYARSGKENDAIAPLRKAIELDPKSADAYTVLGGILNQEKKFADAEANLSKATEVAPTSYEAQYQLGRALFYQQKPAEAEPHLRSALQQNKNSAEAHIMLANVLLHLRNAEGALKEYQEGVKLDPKGPMAQPAKQMIAQIQTALTAQSK
jgi:tetratricopeptide (TPR) repeat protein